MGSPDLTRPADEHVVDLHGLTHGGEAVGRLPSGKAVFVAFAIPGERVRITVEEDHRRWARGRLLEVVEASPDRVTPPCPYFGPPESGAPTTCGGCAFQHVSAERQAVMKQRILREQLERIGKLVDPPVRPTVSVGLYGYRQRARFAVTSGGGLGFRRLRSNDVVPIDVCALLHPDAQRLREEAGDAWSGAEEVEVHTGDEGRMLVVHPGPGGLPPLPDGDAPVAITGPTRHVALRGEPQIVHRVAGTDLRVSPTSFFQASTAAAETLAGLVRDSAAARSGETVCDLFAGVGLFSVVLAAEGAVVTAVEAHPPSAADARANLADVPNATVLVEGAAAAVQRWAGEHRWFDVVVLDPPRRGAGPELCRGLMALEPRCVVYVSCDPAALARDARALADAGMRLAAATPIDQFAQTAAIETVAVFTRDGPDM